jgi:hypothetical protein
LEAPPGLVGKGVIRFSRQRPWGAGGEDFNHDLTAILADLAPYNPLNTDYAAMLLPQP